MDTPTPDRTPAPLHTVQGVYAALGRGDLPALFELLQPQIDWSATCVAPGAERVPMLRHGVGHGAVEHASGGAAHMDFHVFDGGRLFVDHVSAPIPRARRAR